MTSPANFNLRRMRTQTETAQPPPRARSRSPVVLRLGLGTPADEGPRKITEAILIKLLQAGLCTKEECEDIIQWMRASQQATPGQYKIVLTDLWLRILGPLVDRESRILDSYKQIETELKKLVSIPLDSWLTRFIEIRLETETLPEEIKKISDMYKERLQQEKERAERLVDSYQKTLTQVWDVVVASSESLQSQANELQKATAAITLRVVALEGIWEDEIRPLARNITQLGQGEKKQREDLASLGNGRLK